MKASSVRRFMERLSGRSVALDTAIFIYLIEEHEEYAPLVVPLFQSVDAGKREVFTSAITLLEVLVVPYRAGDLALAEAYERLLTGSRGVHVVPVDNHQLRTAAQLRAHHRIRTPDALQLATARTRRCDVFVTNDRELPSVEGLDVLQLRDFVSAL